LKNHGVVHISFTRPPSVIRSPEGLAVPLLVKRPQADTAFAAKGTE
jgi:hypothetical protein